ncbi:diguanylate cyclase [Planosporangium sp. 12N6]|uniref:GGDEF domain-containing protein n=1 Tax=Planosporangium spinosum TaxID=3402278 RepID=UPI003CE9CD26
MPASEAHAPTAYIVDLAGLTDPMPRTEGELAAALQTMEMVPVDEYRTVVGPAERAERLAAELGRPDLQMRARLILADVLRRDGDMVESSRIAHEILAAAIERGDDYLRARCHHLLAYFFRHIGDSADALSHAVQCVARTHDDVPARIRARHLSVLAATLQQSGSRDEARRRFQEALDIATATGDSEMQLQILNNLAYTEYQNRDSGAANAHIAQMRAVQARAGVTLNASYLDTIARVEMMSGRYAEAEATLRPVLDESAGHLLADADSLGECLLTVAEVQRLRGDVVAAQITLDRTVRVCQERGLASARARARDEQAQLYAATGRYREAYEEHRRFHNDTMALQSAQREARARALQAVFETEEARRESVRFRELAQRDALTGLYNRRYIDEQLAGLLERAASDRAPLAAALIDLDHFKRVNDTCSHATGDAVLQQVAMLLEAAAPGPAVAARLGGEEFLLILPDTDADAAVRHCERLREAIARHAWGPVTGGLPVTASIGVTCAAAGQTTSSALLAQADRNLYAAKRTGRNRVVADPG